MKREHTISGRTFLRLEKRGRTIRRVARPAPRHPADNRKTAGFRSAHIPPLAFTAQGTPAGKPGQDRFHPRRFKTRFMESPARLNIVASWTKLPPGASFSHARRYFSRTRDLQGACQDRSRWQERGPEAFHPGVRRGHAPPWTRSLESGLSIFFYGADR